MKKSVKKIISLMLSAVMTASALFALPFVSEAAIKWTAVASSDFSSVESVYNDSGITPSALKGKGNTMSWHLYDWTGNPSVTDDSVYLPDGYMYLSGYKGGSVPISGASKWKLDFSFRFKTNESGDEAYYNSDDFSFLKMYVYTDNLGNPAEKNAAFCYFAQNANGLCYSWEDDGHNAGIQSRETSISANNGNLLSGVNYHYIAEFTGSSFKAYIRDEDGAVVQTIAETAEETFISRLNNIKTETISALKIGDDDNQYYFKGLEYRNITFFSGDEIPAPTVWSPIASSDFTKCEAVTNGRMAEAPLYNEKGSAMTWSTGVYTNNGNASDSEDGAVYIPDGYMYLSGYSGGSVPITGASRWKLDFGFRFKNADSADYYNSDEYSFIKMYVYTDNLSNPAEKNAAFCYFAQNANGVCYSWENDGHNAGTQSKATSICANNGVLSVGVNYHYVAEFTGNSFKAYITDESGNIIQNIAETTEETFISRLNNIKTETISALKIGDDDNQYFFKGLEYRNITFFSGEEGEDEEETDLPATPAGRLLRAISQYEKKMNGTVYLDMADAYDAYVKANQAYDAYKYGNAEVDLDFYASLLNEKTQLLEKWEYKKETVTPYFDGDTGDNSAYAENGVANVIYWGSPYENDGAKFSNETADCVIELWYPQSTVLLLDGITAPAMPILGMAKRDTSSTRYVYQLYPCASPDDTLSNSENFKLGTSSDTRWFGSNGKTHRTHNWVWTVNQKQGEDVGYIKGEAGATATDTRLYLSRNDGMFGAGAINYWASFANTLRFKGNQSEYVKSYTVDWYAVTGNDMSDFRVMSPSNQIHVVNIKPLLERINSVSNLAYLSVSENTYTQGGLKALLEAYDIATAVNACSYDYSDSSNLSRIASDIERACNALDSAEISADNSGYTALRKAINAKKRIYEAGEEGYKAASWSEFEGIYNEALRIFAEVLETGYNSETISTATGDYAAQVAQQLDEYELVTLYDKVNTAELEDVINEADYAAANSSVFTPESYDEANIEEVSSAAKAAVWGNEEDYPNAKFKLNLSDENNEIVSQQINLVKEAIYKLKINKDAPIASLDDKSMNSAVAWAENYSSEDYGNHAELASAVAAAQGFIVTVNNASKGCIENKISEYKEKTRAIINAINLLRPAFDKITNGTWGSFTSDDETTVKSTDDNDDRWYIKFIRNNNVVVFRTEYPAFKVDLGGVKFIWHSGDKDHDGHLDTINIYDVSETNRVGEIKSGTRQYKIFGSLDGVSIEDQAEAYPGMLSASTDENSTYTIKNLTVSYSSADRLGKDIDGRDVYDNSFIFDEVLSSTQGCEHNDLKGIISARHGDTDINGQFTVEIPKEPKKTLSATTLPKMTAHTLESNIGMVYYWKYTNTSILWHGYSHDRNAYTQTTYVMNIAPLIELINKAREYEDKEQIYQIRAWNDFASALSAARANMDYGNMNAEDIEAACQTRYTNLWNAFKTLKESPAANNASIHSAVEADENVGNVYKADNRDGRWSSARWEAFKTAYLEAASAIEQGGKYSDYNVRNYDESEQSAIDAVAAALSTAYNELITYGCRADFSPVYNAAKTALADNLYTASSLEALRDELKDSSKYPYLNMSEENRASVYAEQNVVDEISAEANAVAGAFESIPVQKEEGADESALEAAKLLAKAEIKDPDAFSNIDEIKALIDSADNSRSVEIYDGYTVSGVKYATAQEINAAVSSLLSGLTVKKYQINVVDSEGNAVNASIRDENGNEINTENGIDYGTKIIVYAPENEEVDWFYSYSSNTVSETSSKYYTTDKWIHLTVRGNTTLTVKSVAQQNETVKITYVNALTGKTFAVDYAAKDEAYTLQSAPILPYYTFAGYTLEAEGEDYETEITPSEDTIVFANYEFDTANDFFTVTLGNINGSITTTQYLTQDLEYNDLVEFTVGDGTFGEEGSGIYQTVKKNGSQYKINGKVYSLPATTRTPLRYTSNEIYAWVVVKEDDMEDWEEYRGEDYEVDYLQNVEKVVMYGDTYSFRVCENVYVIPYSEEEFNEAAGKGLIEGVSEEEKAAVYANDRILNETGGQKISMIGSFTLPEGDFTLVEAGMLFKAVTDGTIPNADLMLANVGTNGIARMKSSSHTSGNQFVISVNTKKFIGTNTTIGVMYRAYMIYTDGTNQRVVYSDTVTDSALIE